MMKKMAGETEREREREKGKKGNEDTAPSTKNWKRQGHEDPAPRTARGRFTKTEPLAQQKLGEAGPRRPHDGEGKAGPQNI